MSSPEDSVPDGVPSGARSSVWRQAIVRSSPVAVTSTVSRSASSTGRPAIVPRKPRALLLAHARAGIATSNQLRADQAPAG